MIRTLRLKRRGLLLPLLLFGCAGLHAQEIPRVVLGTGAVQAVGSGTAVAGTIGQAVIGFVRTGEEGTGQGFWASAQRSTLAVENPVAGDESLSSLSLQCAPNPVAKSATVQATVPDNGPATLTLHDLLGREVLSLAKNERIETGRSFRLDAGGLESGRYTLVLRAGAARITTPVHIVR